MAKCGMLAVLACLAALCAVEAQVTMMPGLPVSGKMYVQSFAASYTAGAGGTTPGGGGRRLLEAGPGRSLLQSNTATNESAIVVAGLNAVCSTNTGRKLLQKFGGEPTTGGPGLEIIYAAKLNPVTNRVTVILEFPSIPGNIAILTAATTSIPASAPPTTFFNAEVAIGSAVAVSKTGFLATTGGVVRVRLSFDLAGTTTLPTLQFSFQYATNLAAPQPGFFFANAVGISVVPDKAGLPTVKGLLDTLT